MSFDKVFPTSAFSSLAIKEEDKFCIYAEGIVNEGYKLLIFNRWNEVIFEALDQKTGWDSRVKNNSNPPQEFTRGQYSISIFWKNRSFWGWQAFSQAIFCSILRGDIWNFHAGSARVTAPMMVFSLIWYLEIFNHSGAKQRRTMQIQLKNVSIGT